MFTKADMIECLSHFNSQEIEDKRRQREEIEALTAEYLARGGRIEQAVCAPLRCVMATYKDPGTMVRRWEKPTTQVARRSKFRPSHSDSRIVLRGSHTGRAA